MEINALVLNNYPVVYKTLTSLKKHLKVDTCLFYETRENYFVEINFVKLFTDKIELYSFATSNKDDAPVLVKTLEFYDSFFTTFCEIGDKYILFQKVAIFANGKIKNAIIISKYDRENKAKKWENVTVNVYKFVPPTISSIYHTNNILTPSSLLAIMRKDSYESSFLYETIDVKINVTVKRSDLDKFQNLIGCKVTRDEITGTYFGGNHIFDKAMNKAFKFMRFFTLPNSGSNK